MSGEQTVWIPRPTHVGFWWVFRPDQSIVFRQPRMYAADDLADKSKFDDGFLYTPCIPPEPPASLD